MELAFWIKFLLPLYLVIIDLTSSTETTTEHIKNYGNRIKRARAQREKIEKSSDKSKREITQNELKRNERQTKGPPADHSYDFAFRTPEYQRRENADELGRVRGLYSFIDDVGEKHLVRYAASADRGFEVFNSVPDASRYVQYSAPLYKTSPKARGRIAYERGPGRQYKFISAGPDQRRSESIGPDGVTRGAYSYLDPEGVQRTTQYIAGAGIGYRVVQDTTGPQTHLLPRPAVVEFGILYPRNQPGNRGNGNQPGNSGDPGSDFDRNNGILPPNGDGDGPGGIGGGGGSGVGGNGNGADGNGNGIGGGGGGGGGGGVGGIGSGGGGGSGGIPGFDDNSIDLDGDRDDFDDGNRRGGRPGGDRTDFPKRDRGGGTIITNIGDTFFGIPPGASARAHVQNIDLKPYGEDGALSPSEALRRDERRSLRQRFRG